MTQTFTQDDLLRHLYTEESPQQGEALDAFISSSEQMSQNFDNFCLVRDALNQIQLEPTSHAVLSILSYSALSQYTLKKNKI